MAKKPKQPERRREVTLTCPEWDASRPRIRKSMAKWRGWVQKARDRETSDEYFRNYDALKNLLNAIEAKAVDRPIDETLTIPMKESTLSLLMASLHGTALSKTLQTLSDELVMVAAQKETGEGDAA
jgi:hypothetical protein